MTKRNYVVTSPSGAIIYVGQKGFTKGEAKKEKKRLEKEHGRKGFHIRTRRRAMFAKV